MNVIEMKTNRMVEPLGFDFQEINLSWNIVDNDNSQEIKNIKVQIALDKSFNDLVYECTLNDDVNNLQYIPNVDWQPCTRYYWRIIVEMMDNDIYESECTWFETSKMDTEFSGKFITANIDQESSFEYLYKFKINKDIKKARAYACGLGLYEFYINNDKVGNEYLAPGCNNYDAWIQYQTYDVTPYLTMGDNSILAITGDGWYKGNFGYNGGADHIYGDQQCFLCEVVIEFNDGSKETVTTNDNWLIRDSKIRYSSIYHGECIDANYFQNIYNDVYIANIDMTKLKPRLSLPVTAKEYIKPQKLIHTPKGELVLDMGQNMVGWLSFVCKEKSGSEICLQFGEILQDGNFYRDNMRLAKAQFTYISDGIPQEVRPHFTYYGFRYVKVEGINEIDLNDFKGWVLYSNMEHTGELETGNSKVNKLISNVLWSQKGNFFDTPTDCPQRDERLGWTGDAQVFCGAASYNMDIYAFMKKYCYDLKTEQESRNGSVPMVVPSFHQEDAGSSAWGDAAVIIPWTMYVRYGDDSILRQNYEAMKSWIHYIQGQIDNDGLWRKGFHYGDWLALDTDEPGNPVGKTEISFIATCYFYLSTKLVAKSAEVLTRQEDMKYYQDLAMKIKKDIQNEYLTVNGRLTLQTQTAYALALYVGIVPLDKISRVARDLNNQIEEDKGFLTTGFVGTPYLCKVLSENGYHDRACKILVNEQYPGWLYEVNMGATTVWERWNSVMIDGHMNIDGMNSLNHYAYGSIIDWMYQYLAGIQPLEKTPGFKEVLLRPMPNYNLKYLKAKYLSATGRYQSHWKICDSGDLEFYFEIPTGGLATLVLPDARIEDVIINQQKLSDYGLDITSKESNLYFKLGPGEYNISYLPTKQYIQYFNMEMPLCELLASNKAREVLEKTCPAFVQLDEGIINMVGHFSPLKIKTMPFYHGDDKQIEIADKLLRTIPIN